MSVSIDEVTTEVIPPPESDAQAAPNNERPQSSPVKLRALRNQIERMQERAARISAD